LKKTASQLIVVGLMRCTTREEKGIDGNALWVYRIDLIAAPATL
jgi:hypothetical protein